MAAWLRTAFIRVGIVALVVEALSRFYYHVGMSLLTQWALQRGATFDTTDRLAHVAAVLDIAAGLLWGLFSLGFALRMVNEFNLRKPRQE